VKSVEELEQKVGLRVIATIPKLEPNELEHGHAFVDILNATSLSISQIGKVLSVHSSMPSEGKSTVCSKTAIESGRAGSNVLVIDMDVRRPTAHELLDVKLRDGIADVLESHRTDDIASKVKASKYPGVSVLTAGVYNDGPPLSPRLMQEIISAFREEYDLILIDCPPVTVVNESLIIANSSDEIIIVVRPNFSDYKLIKRAVRMLKELDCHLIGVVANQVSKKSPLYYSNKIYNKYYLSK
jgi:capsular exopolysaccharide synthesis family protein